ncbi:MAG: AidA/PixA family protein [Pandoraea sp.]|nr:AidA/PixA family protein [Pandoraea sp.]MDR3400548.1 AidA/PixA family protein [Pandoraea sp.]
MSEARTSDTGSATGATADVLLVIDTVTLLDRHPDAADNPVDIESDGCYGLAPDSQALDGVSAAPWPIDVRTGDRVRLRWTPLAMRGEHAVLLELSLTDETVLGGLRMHVHEHAPRYAPQSGSPEQPVAREAPDAFWQADVIASGTAEVDVVAIVTDRDASVLARFRWSLPVVVP